MSKEGKKDSGFVGLVGGLAAGAGAFHGTKKWAEGRVIKDAAATVAEGGEIAKRFTKDGGKVIADAIHAADETFNAAKTAAGSDKGLVKAAKEAYKGALKSEDIGGLLKHTGMKEKAVIAVATIVAAVVGKKILDATIGKRKESHVEALESRSAAAEGHSR